MHFLHYFTRLELFANAFNWQFRMLACLPCIFLTLSCEKEMAIVQDDLPAIFNLSLPNETTTIVIGAGGTDTIMPGITLPDQTDVAFNSADYSFLWTNLNTGDTLSTNPYLTYKDFENQELTMISCLLNVKDKTTGFSKHASTAVFVTTATREGWVLLGEKNGAATLSMLSFSPKGYKKYIDLGTELGKHIDLSGKPISISSLGSESNYGTGGKFQFIGVVTDQEVKFIRSIDFEVNTKISSYLTQTLQPDATEPIYLARNGGQIFTATKQNQVYAFNIAYMVNYDAMAFTQLNSYAPGSLFDASQKSTIFGGVGGTLQDSRILFDEDDGVFVRAYDATLRGNGPTVKLALPLPVSLKGYQLRAVFTDMKNPSNDYRSWNTDVDEVTGFLYHPVTQESYIIQFLTNGIFRSIKKVPEEFAAEMAASKFIEIDIRAGYIIYLKGNEVHAYDYLANQPFKLLSYQDETITFIKMEPYFPFNPFPGRDALYKGITHKLVVGTYNPAKPDNSGTFRMYRIQLAHQMPMLETEETGFPKIIDAGFIPLP